MPFLNDKKQQMDEYIDFALAELSGIAEDLDRKVNPYMISEADQYPVRYAMAGLEVVKEFIQSL